MSRGPGSKPWLFFFWLLLAQTPVLAQSQFADGLLFRIENKAGVASYLFGTIHSEDPRVTELPEPVRLAFDVSEQLALEIDINPLALLASLGAMMLDEGQDLRSLAGDALYGRCLEAAASIGLPELLLNRYKPWALAVMLSLPPVETGQFLDLLLYQSASARGKTVVGLETVDEQLDAFDGLSTADQLVLLDEALNNLDRLPILFEALIETYLRRDLDGLADLSTEHFQGDSEVMTRFQESAIFSRNRRMVDRLAPYIERGGTFAAVGALHLPGEQGMLNLLRKRGYLVEKRY